MANVFDLNINRIVVQGTSVASDGQYDAHRANAALKNGLILNVEDLGNGILDLLISRESGAPVKANLGIDTPLGRRIVNLTTESSVVVDNGFLRRKTRINFFPRQ